MKIKDLIAMLQTEDPENEAVLILHKAKANCADSECLGVIGTDGEPMYGKLRVGNFLQMRGNAYDVHHELSHAAERADRCLAENVKTLESGEQVYKNSYETCEGYFYRTFYKRYLRMRNLGFKRFKGTGIGTAMVCYKKNTYRVPWFWCDMNKERITK